MFTNEKVSFCHQSGIYLIQKYSENSNVVKFRITFFYLNIIKM